MLIIKGSEDQINCRRGAMSNAPGVSISEGAKQDRKEPTTMCQTLPVNAANRASRASCGQAVHPGISTSLHKMFYFSIQISIHYLSLALTFPLLHSSDSVSRSRQAEYRGARLPDIVRFLLLSARLLPLCHPWSCITS